MKRFTTHLLILSVCSLCTPWFNASLRAEAPAEVDKASKEMAASARKFLDSLSPEQRAIAGFEFKDNERLNWHFIPKPRKGLTLKDMSEEQRNLAKSLLSTGLSQKASAKALTIMSLEQILHELEKDKPNAPKRDSEMYYWSIFGNPGDPKAPWGWRIEGHHISMNFTIINDQAVAAAPVFLGANPAEVRDGPRKGLRVLADEEDKGRAFVKSLSEAQMKKALIAQTSPTEIITAAKRQAVLDKFEGIPFAELTDPQKSALMDLVALYATRLRSELAQDDLRRIAQADLSKIHFGWAGGTERGQAHYYRIHGPNFLVEYDNTQNDANHIHSVWRDLENDFGGDLLKKHYDVDHK